MAHDPWRGGFTGYIETVCAVQAADRGFADVLTMSLPGVEALEACRAEAYQGFLELIARAQDSGVLRANWTGGGTAAAGSRISSGQSTPCNAITSPRTCSRPSRSRSCHA
ncbi:hypothetical protein ACIQFZ_41945 [Streptomyces sp. NPDC093064]|uniref:hypothetical protein n=1 Tax=Streptomyces sp. NPDC093064 TaxID=3366020 RepID=UPI0038099962